MQLITMGANVPLIDGHGTHWHIKKSTWCLVQNFLDPQKNPTRSCDCTNSTCFATGCFQDQDPMLISKAVRDTVLNTPYLLSQEKKAQYINNPQKKLCIAPWHFFVKDLELIGGKWKLKYNRKENKKYRNLENRQYNFPPPPNVLRQFLNKVYFLKHIRLQDQWSQSNSINIPVWMSNIIEINVGMLPTDEDSFSSS